MNRRRSLLDTALFAAARSSLEISHRLEVAGARLRDASGNFFAQLLSPAQRETFSMQRYSASVREAQAHRGLRGWEREWFKRALPPAPGRLLVAACGTGREVLELGSLGYTVDAFDGASQALTVARKTCLGAGVFEATYRDLIEATLQGADNALSGVARTRYSAVVLGWGSLTHVAGSKERGLVLRACATLTDGPILCSFFAAPKDTQRRSETDRWVRWGRALGTRMGRAEGPAYVQLSHWGGFAEYLDKEELALHGAALGRRIEWDEGNSASFPHVTLISPSQR